jgi:hypothetical protein
LRSKAAIISGLLVVNILLSGLLVWNIYARSPAASIGSESVQAPLRDSSHSPTNSPPPRIIQPARESVTAFLSVYSARPSEFVSNLRRVGCPEETVKDILVAEMNRRFRAQEDVLRPKPADHVPWGWSPKTSEAKLLERRQQAAAIAREKEATLRGALGYDVHVPMPIYAMTVGDRRFQETVESMPANVRQVAYQLQEQYWSGVEQLRARTQGFWEPADVEELKELKRERSAALEALAQAR